MEKDTLFNRPINIEDFIFDENVSRVFDDMIDRSVPGYRSLISNIGVIAGQFLQPGTCCYDLGCSHAGCLFAVWRTNPNVPCHYIGIDQSDAMIHQCLQRIKSEDAQNHIQAIQADVCEAKLTNASLVILNLTLQFIQRPLRDKLIQHVYSALNASGALILTEKVRFHSAEEEKLFDSLHTLFKKCSGYSELEISQKRKALENVLIRETEEQHIRRLKDIGFTQVYRWFQCYNFISLIAIK